jgi:hypothetical protein
MRFLPKTHFRWREPKLFLRLNDAYESSGLNWWHRPLWSLVGAVVLMGNWLLAHINPRTDAPPLTVAILIALAGGAFFVYVIPWMISLCPSEVRFYHAYIVRSRGNTARRIDFANIASFSWRTRDEFATLILMDRKRGKEIFLGAPFDVDQAEVTRFLLDRGVAENKQDVSTAA